jgi:fimbrial chaperone protein
LTGQLLCGGLTLFLACAANAAAGQLQAAPTLLEIGPESAATRLILGNTGHESIAAQVRVYAWSQVSGEDRLVPTDQLVVSPPIAELPAGSEQVVRVVRLGPAASERDQTFRVVVDELPRDGIGGDSTVKLRLRYVLPLFVRGPNVRPPSLTCTITSNGAQLACENSGGRAAQLGASRLVDEDGRTQNLSDGLYGYVLPASRRIWQVSADGPALTGPALKLETRLNGQPATLAVDRRQ